MKCNATPRAQTIKMNVDVAKDTYVSKHIYLIVLFFNNWLFLCAQLKQLFPLKFHLVGKQKPQLQEYLKHQFP